MNGVFKNRNQFRPEICSMGAIALGILHVVLWDSDFLYW